jgi:hypothetical protein
MLKYNISKQMEVSKMKINELVLKTESFLNELKYISNFIEDRDIYKISNKLKNCTHNLTDILEKGLQENERIKKIRAFVRVNSSLEECKSYLSLIDQLQYYQTDYAQIELDNINKEIIDNYQTALN